MKQFGDITKIDGHNVPLVDIVTGGSPCQDLSVAGKRAGLAGERSGLFMEQIRVIKEMRDESAKQLRSRGATFDIRCVQPRYMVWENVPGAFSSNKGEDFRAVLEETAKVVEETATIPQSRGGGLLLDVSWETGGLLLGVYTMHSFGECPNVERESRLSQILEDSPHPKYCLSAKACQGILRRAEKRGKELPPLLRETLLKQSAFKNELENQGGVKEFSYNTREQEPCLHSTINPSCLSIDEKMGQTYVGENIGNTLGARDYKQPQAVVYGMSSYDSNSMKSSNPHSGIYIANTTRTLDNNGGNPACNQGGMICLQRRFSSVNVSEDGITSTLEAGAGEGGNNMPIVLEGNGQRASHKGDGYKESETMYTLNSTEQHGVCTYQETTGTLTSGAHPGSYNGQDAYNDMLVIGGGTEPITASKASFFLNARSDGTADTLVATDYKDPQMICYGLDRASFNQGENAKYNFSIEEEKAQSLMARGPGGGTATP